jgi:glycerophosphoryl diester phosphodiesterase
MIDGHVRSAGALWFLGCLLGPVAAQDHPVLHQLRQAVARDAAVVAHRGASETHPENTVAALRAARVGGAHVVEFDVHQTKDGAWVLLHDATCDRTTDAVAKFGRKEVRVDELTLAEVATLDAGSWRDTAFAGERVPTLEAALAAVFPAVPMIERKGGDAAALVAELRRLEVVDRVLVQAFDWDWLAAVHRAEPKLLLGALGGKELTPERLDRALAIGARLVHWDHRTLDVIAASMVRERGALLCVYTVDPDMVLVGAAAIGCDLITTNRPDRAIMLRDLGALARPRAKTQHERGR